jgi:hypothetical protein
LRPGATELNDLENGEGIFLFELTPDIGGTVSLKDQVAGSDWNFQVKNFRHFPSRYELNGVSLVEQLSIDSSIDTVSLAFQSDFVNLYPNEISLLPNKWERTTDYSACPDYISNSGSASDVQGFVVMNSTDLSIRAAAQIDIDGIDIMRSLQIVDLEETNTVALAGTTTLDFNVAGVIVTRRMPNKQRGKLGHIFRQRATKPPSRFFPVYAQRVKHTRPYLLCAARC